MAPLILIAICLCLVALLLVNGVANELRHIGDVLERMDAREAKREAREKPKERVIGTLAR